MHGIKPLALLRLTCRLYARHAPFIDRCALIQDDPRCVYTSFGPAAIIQHNSKQSYRNWLHYSTSVDYKLLSSFFEYCQIDHANTPAIMPCATAHAYNPKMGHQRVDWLNAPFIGWMSDFVHWMCQFVRWLCEIVRSKVNWFVVYETFIEFVYSWLIVRL